MSKTHTTGKRYLKNGVWHDDDGPIPGYPDQWQPPMTEAEIKAAASDDPDCPPSSLEKLQRARRVSSAKLIRQRLRMSREDFAAVYAIPYETLRAWESHEAEPSPVELAFLRAIAAAPDAVRRALAPEPAA